MALLPQDFRGDVVGGSADGFSLLSVVFELTSKAEIPHFNVHLIA